MFFMQERGLFIPSMGCRSITADITGLFFTINIDMIADTSSVILIRMLTSQFCFMVFRDLYFCQQNFPPSVCEWLCFICTSY